jgi:hypothetical protein
MDGTMHNRPVRLAFVAIAALLAFPWPAASQDKKPLTGNDAAPPETVIVTGKKPSDQKSLDDVVRAFVDAHAKYSPKIDQLTRWVTPVCPEVRNLPGGYGDFITKRIKAIAASVGAPTKEPCKLDIEIIFSADPQAILDKVAASDERLLGYHFVHDTNNAAKVTQPIQAWYVTSTSNALKTYIDDPYHQTPSGTLGTRFSHGLYSVFNHILIIVNTDKVAGYPIGPVADYIAMLALSQAEAPDNCNDLDSILDYMAPNCTQKPESLTVADKTYLEGLYHMDKWDIGSLQKSNISEHMQDDMSGK